MQSQQRPVSSVASAGRRASPSATGERLGAAQLVLPVLVALAMMLGGGGSPAPLPELLLEWTALSALAAAVWLEPESSRWPPLALLVAVLVVLLPLAQLLPLPPELWRSLPGRENQAAALSLVGEGTRWMPWSISPPRTLAALLALLPPIVALLLTARAGQRTRTITLLVIVTVALLAVALGAAQLAAGRGSWLRFYGDDHAGYLTGFHGNRNAAADALLIGLLAGVAVWLAQPEEQRLQRRLPACAAALLLVIATLLTGSRAGIALLVAVLAGLVVWFAPWRGRHALPRRLALLAGAGLLAAAAGAWLLVANPAVRQIAARFGQRGEFRPQLWIDTWHAIGQHWPTGAGLGSFVPVFLAAERLEVVDQSRPNRAHNDYLELTLEAGIPGLLVLAIITLLLAWRLVAGLRAANGRGHRGHLIFAAATLMILAAHSIVDYPFRSMALATLAGVAAGIILAPGGRSETRSMQAGRVEIDKA